MKYIIFTALLCMHVSKAQEPKFFFGVSNASFQVEGSPMDSDWRKWTQTTFEDGTPHITDKTNAERATDFWNRYEEDFMLAKNYSMNAFRISIAWERVEKQQGVWDEEAIKHYGKMILAMQKNGLTPFITLLHYTLPLWVSEKGGIIWDKFPDHFALFAQHIVDVLSSPPYNVRYFITINEPNIQVRFGFLDDKKFPPGVNDPNLAGKALFNLTKAHIRAYEAIHSLLHRDIKVGLSHNWQIFRPFLHDGMNQKDIQNNIATTKKVQWMFNESIMGALKSGDLRFSILGGKEFRETIYFKFGKSLDFLGIQNYGRSYVAYKATPPLYELSEGNGIKNDLGWELVPHALYLSVYEASRYKYPMIITETGLADKEDTNRPMYLRWNFEDINRLLSEKIDIFGYIHWSLTDNFEWAFGLTPRFGLVNIDYKTLQRTPRPSLQTYCDLIKSFNENHPNIR